MVNIHSNVKRVMGLFFAFMEHINILVKNVAERVFVSMIELNKIA
jgi:hypothetical protein